jgi:hypothetical protein
VRNTADGRDGRHKIRSTLNQIVIALMATVNFVAKSGSAISIELYAWIVAGNRGQFYLVVHAFIYIFPSPRAAFVSARA